MTLHSINSYAPVATSHSVLCHPYSIDWRVSWSRENKQVFPSPTKIPGGEGGGYLSNSNFSPSIPGGNLFSILYLEEQQSGRAFSILYLEEQQSGRAFSILYLEEQQSGRAFSILYMGKKLSVFWGKTMKSYMTRFCRRHCIFKQVWLYNKRDETHTSQCCASVPNNNYCFCIAETMIVGSLRKEVSAGGGPKKQASCLLFLLCILSVFFPY